MISLRCLSKKHGELLQEDEIIEVSCNSSRCGWRRGLLVLHRFRMSDGVLVDTKIYKNPRKEKG